MHLFVSPKSFLRIGVSMHRTACRVGVSMHRTICRVGVSMHRTACRVGISMHRTICRVGVSMHRTVCRVGVSLHRTICRQMTLLLSDLMPLISLSGLTTLFSTPRLQLNTSRAGRWCLREWMWPLTENVPRLAPIFNRSCGQRDFCRCGLVGGSGEFGEFTDSRPFYLISLLCTCVSIWASAPATVTATHCHISLHGRLLFFWNVKLLP